MIAEKHEHSFLFFPSSLCSKNTLMCVGSALARCPMRGNNKTPEKGSL